MLLGLYRLVQPLGIAAAEHEAAGELVDYDDLAVFHDVVDVALHHAVGLDRLVDVVVYRRVLDVREVLEAESLLGLGYAAGGERRGASLFVDDVIRVEDVYKRQGRPWRGTPRCRRA